MNTLVSFTELQPLDIIHIDDITLLPAVEDVVAESIDPAMSRSTEEAWVGRVAIKDLIRPPKFNGRITNIDLMIMDEPYERRLDARKRGWRLQHTRTSPSSDPKVVDSYVGFQMTADAKSSGRGVVGQIQAEMWYSLIPSRDYFRYTAPHGVSVNRVVTFPRFEKEAFTELHDTSRTIAFEVLRRSMMSPITQPMRN